MSRVSLVSLERALRTPTPVGDDDGGGTVRPRHYQYARLAQVSLLDTYYNASQDACADFTVQPTPTTADLMQDLGLLLRTGSTGFSVLYDEQRHRNLLDFLQAQYHNGPEPTPACCPDARARTGQAGVWSKLSFVLALNDPLFLSFTDLPVGLNPALTNLYFTDREAHRQPVRGLLLNRGPYVASPRRPNGEPKPGVSQLLTVIDGQHPVPTRIVAPPAAGLRADCVRVVDVRGEVLICQPSCVESGGTAPRQVCRERVYLDFGALPLGRYEVQWILGDSVAQRLVLLYTNPSPVPLAFVDLFLTDPTTTQGQPDGGPGIFPVRNLWTQPEIVGPNYRLRFRRRATNWTYYVVSARELSDLRIEGSATFTGPTPVVLADGRRAYRFVSEEALALEQESRHRFALYGRPANAVREIPLYDPLPLAAPRDVVAKRAPHVGLATATRADIYVHLQL